jgi:PKD repeat protein
MATYPTFIRVMQTFGPASPDVGTKTPLSGVVAFGGAVGDYASYILPASVPAGSAFSLASFFKPTATITGTKGVIGLASSVGGTIKHRIECVAGGKVQGVITQGGSTFTLQGQNVPASGEAHFAALSYDGSKATLWHKNTTGLVEVTLPVSLTPDAGSGFSVAHRGDNVLFPGYVEQAVLYGDKIGGAHIQAMLRSSFDPTDLKALAVAATPTLTSAQAYTNSGLGLTRYLTQIPASITLGAQGGDPDGTTHRVTLPGGSGIVAGQQIMAGWGFPATVLGVTVGTQDVLTVESWGGVYATGGRILTGFAPLAPVISVVPGDSLLVVGWDPVGLASGYQVYLNGMPYGGTLAGNSETITGLANGTSYTITVAALNRFGSSPVSNTVVITPSAAPVGAPAAPTISTAVAGINDVALTWGSVATATSYQPFVNGAAFGSPVGTTSVDVTGLLPSTTYSFTVRAINGSGASPLSPVVSRTTLNVQGGGSSMLFGISNNNLAAFDSALGYPVQVVRDYTTLDNPTPTVWKTIKNGRQQVLTSMKFKHGANQVPNQVPAGTWDAAIIAYANWCQTYGLDCCFEHEFDASTVTDAASTSQINTAVNYAINLARAQGGFTRPIYACMTGFQISIRGPLYAAILANADGIMIDSGYSDYHATGTTSSFDNDVSADLTWIAANYPTKPIFITEWGLNPTSEAFAANWITAAAAAMKNAKYAMVKAATYWSGTTSATFDTRIIPGTAAFTAFINAAKSFSTVVAPGPVTANFTDSISSLTVNFDGTSSTAPGSSIASYAWDFGDGGSSSSATPAHTYASSGTYTVTLTVTSAAGANDVATDTVTVVSGGSPIAFVGADHDFGNGTSRTVTIPSSVATGNGMLLCVTGNLAPSDTITVPAGWTLVDVQSVSSMKSAVYRRVATGTDHGTTVTVTVAGATHMTVELVAYSGTNATNPVVAYAKSIVVSTTASYTSPTSTVPVTGDFVVTYYAAKSSSITVWHVPTGQTSRDAANDTGGGHINSLIVDKGQQASGACGGITATTDSAASALAAWTIVLGA